MLEKNVHALKEDVRLALSESLLAKFPPQALEQLLGTSVKLSAPAGSTIYEMGEQASFGLITSGLLRMYMTSPDGRQVTVRYARTGEMVGIPATIGHGAPVSTQVLTNTTGLIFSSELLRKLGQSDAKVAWLLSEEVTRRVFDLLETLAGYSFATIRQKVAWHLLELAATGQKDDQLIAYVTQQELADAIGSVRQVVARTLRDLRTVGLVETSSTGIHLLKPEDLHEQAWRPKLSQK